MLLESNLKNYARAIHLGKELLPQTTDKVHLREINYLIASSYSQIEDFFGCEEYLEKSVAVDSSVDNAKAIFELAGVYSSKEKQVKLEKLAPKLLSWEHYFFPISFLLIESAAKMGDKELLRERIKKISYYFDKIDKIQFSKIIHYTLAAELWDLAEVAIRRFEEKNGTYSIVSKVKLLEARGQKQEALDLFYKQDLEKINSEHLYYMAGQLEAKEKNYARSFEMTSKAAEILAPIVAKKNFKSHVKAYNGLIPKLAKRPAQQLNNTGKKLVFIVGFPRSGTTLLDNILDTQKDALVLSERNIITNLFFHFAKFNKKYPNDLVRLTDKEIEHLRQQYFEVVADQGFEIPESGLIIEKGPHYTEMIPFIKLLFPDAKIITTIRHPLDVCLSCFQTSFEMNHYNAQLIKFEQIVQRYNDVFSLLERYESELGIEHHVIRYEDLVVDIEGEMAKVFDYIEIEPDKAYLEFNKHADSKFVMSASRGQTNKALYTSSRYKWRNYEEQLAPYKEKLNHFIEKYGYEA